ncbi:MAG: hypothetical protein AAGG07_03815 [Planctomycetota bacterium]
MIRTLWDLIASKPEPKPRRVRRTSRAAPRPDAAPRRDGPMAARYRSMQREMLARYGVRVRKWRTSMSGVAWQVTYKDGTMARLIESPQPRGPMSAAVFLHEIGHHAIGFNRYSPRCLEEYHAWRFAIEAMQERGLNVTNAVLKRRHESLRYAIDKAVRRGLRRLPEELEPFLEPFEPPAHRQAG